MSEGTRLGSPTMIGDTGIDVVGASLQPRFRER